MRNATANLFAAHDAWYEREIVPAAMAIHDHTGLSVREAIDLDDGEREAYLNVIARRIEKAKREALSKRRPGTRRRTR